MSMVWLAATKIEPGYTFNAFSNYFRQSSDQRFGFPSNIYYMIVSTRLNDFFAQGRIWFEFAIRISGWARIVSVEHDTMRAAEGCHATAGGGDWRQETSWTRRGGSSFVATGHSERTNLKRSETVFRISENFSEFLRIFQNFWEFFRISENFSEFWNFFRFSEIDT